MNCTWTTIMIDSCQVCDVSSEQVIKKPLDFVLLGYKVCQPYYSLQSVPHGQNMHHPVALYDILTAITKRN